MKSEWILTDFNEMMALDGAVSLSTDGRVCTAGGQSVTLREGMSLTAYEPDVDKDGQPCELVAWGFVTKTPHPKHSEFWILKVDQESFHHEPETQKANQSPQTTATRSRL